MKEEQALDSFILDLSFHSKECDRSDNFLLIMSRAEFQLVHIQREIVLYSDIAFNLKGIKI